MKKCFILSKGDKYGDVRMDEEGKIYVNLFFNGTSLRFSQEGFLNYAGMIQEAFSKVMDIALNDLTKE